MSPMTSKITCLAFAVLAAAPMQLEAETVALWLFDEQTGVYPSCVLGDASHNNYPLVLGPGGQIVEQRRLRRQ